MKNGIWALYKGEEYEVIRRENGDFQIFTEDKKASHFGFFKDQTDYYCKNVKREEITAIYEVRHHAIYKGLEFPVFREEGSKLLLGSGIHGPDIIKKYAFIEVDRYEYEKWVDRSEVERYFEVKVPMWGFSAQDDK